MNLNNESVKKTLERAIKEGSEFKFLNIISKDINKAYVAEEEINFCLDSYNYLLKNKIPAECAKRKSIIDTMQYIYKKNEGSYGILSTLIK